MLFINQINFYLSFLKGKLKNIFIYFRIVRAPTIYMYRWFKSATISTNSSPKCLPPVSCFMFYIPSFKKPRSPACIVGNIQITWLILHVYLYIQLYFIVNFHSFISLVYCTCFVLYFMFVIKPKWDYRNLSFFIFPTEFWLTLVKKMLVRIFFSRLYTVHGTFSGKIYFFPSERKFCGFGKIDKVWGKKYE